MTTAESAMNKPKGTKPLSEADKASIKEDFLAWSGGYHPGEAGDEHDRYLKEWEERYGHDELDLFLTQWGEEELAKEKSARKDKEAQDLAYAAKISNNPKLAHVWLEYIVPRTGPDGVPNPGCGLCDNKGTLVLCDGTHRYCICPNGRAARLLARGGM